MKCENFLGEKRVFWGRKRGKILVRGRIQTRNCRTSHSGNPGSNPGPVNVGFGVEETLPGRVLHPIFQFLPFSMFPLAFDTRSLLSPALYSISSWQAGYTTNLETQKYLYVTNLILQCISSFAQWRIAELLPQSPCHFALKSSAWVSQALRPSQSRDSSCYVGRRILDPPSLPLYRHADLHAHEFAHSALVKSP